MFGVWGWCLGRLKQPLHIYQGEHHACSDGLKDCWSEERRNNGVGSCHSNDPTIPLELFPVHFVLCCLLPYLLNLLRSLSLPDTWLAFPLYSLFSRANICNWHGIRCTHVGEAVVSLTFLPNMPVAPACLCSLLAQIEPSSTASLSSRSKCPNHSHLLGSCGWLGHLAPTTYGLPHGPSMCLSHGCPPRTPERPPYRHAIPADVQPLACPENSTTTASCDVTDAERVTTTAPHSDVRDSDTPRFPDIPALHTSGCWHGYVCPPHLVLMETPVTQIHHGPSDAEGYACL